MEHKNYREEAEPIAEEIINKIANYMRYKMERWPTHNDLNEMKREVKSIIVQNMYREGKKND